MKRAPYRGRRREQGTGDSSLRGLLAHPRPGAVRGTANTQDCFFSRVSTMDSPPFTQMSPSAHAAVYGGGELRFPREFSGESAGKEFGSPVGFWESRQTQASAETDLAGGQLCRASRTLKSAGAL